MKKLIVLSLLFLIPTSCFAYSTTMHIIHTNNIMLMGAAARAGSSHSRPRVKTYNEKLKECLKHGGGQACYIKYKK